MIRLCRLLATSAAFTSALAFQRVDTHIHALPPGYVEALEAAGGDPSGYPTPEWSLDAAIKSMDQINTDIGILSISTPGVPIAGMGSPARVLARSTNHFLGNTTTASPHANSLGFFGALPDWRDVNGTLAELDHLYQHQRLASGVTAYTAYGSKPLGDPLFAPIWDRLQRYKALVFLHPGALDVRPKFIAERAIGGLDFPGVADKVGYDAARARGDFGRFYYDTALSAGAAQLHGLLDFADPEHIVFGSDVPYAPDVAIESMLMKYAGFVATDDRGDLVSPERLRENSLSLLDKHAMKKRF